MGGIIHQFFQHKGHEVSNSKSGAGKAKSQKTSHRFTRIRTDFFYQSVKIREIGGKGF
jgi:hypothetical protein